MCTSVDRGDQGLKESFCRPRVERKLLHMLQLVCIALLFVTIGSTPARLATCLVGELRVTHLRMILGILS